MHTTPTTNHHHHHHHHSFLRQAEDRSKFASAWALLASAQEGAETRMLQGARTLARLFNVTPRQLTELASVEQLMDEAQAAEEPLHAVMMKLVADIGGHYDRGVGVGERKRCCVLSVRALRVSPHTNPYDPLLPPI